MNPIITTLVRRMEEDALPQAHVSSHWQRHGLETVVEQAGDRLVLKPSGFATLPRAGLRGRALSALEQRSYARVTRSLASFPDVWAAARRLARDLHGGVDFHVFKHACALAVLTDHWRQHGLAPATVALIGDGDGFLGALIARCHPAARLFCIDLPKQLVFQAATQEHANPGRTMGVLLTGNGAAEAECVFVSPSELDAVPGPIDCAVNIASMQEMRADSIAAYFAFLRRRSAPQSRFYCVNRLHKTLVGGEASAFLDYPWQPQDDLFLDGPCPYYRHYFASSTTPRGPRLGGVRIPYVNFFDGEHWHRLVRLAAA